MSFDGVFLYHLTASLHQDIIGARCETFSYDDDVFYLHIYHNKKKSMIVLDLHANQNRFYVTDVVSKKDLSHPLLIKLNYHLSRSVITHIKQYKSDRVLELTLTKHDPFEGDRSFQLVIEFMGKHANLILIQDLMVIEAFKRHISSNHRSILPNVMFTYFPSDKLDVSLLKLPYTESASFYEKTYLGLTLKTAQHMINVHKHPFDLTVVPTLVRSSMYCFHMEDGVTYPSLNALMQVDVRLVSKNYNSIIETSIKKLQLKYDKLRVDLDHNQSKLPLKDIIERIYQEPNTHVHVSSLDAYELDRSLTLHEHAQAFGKLYVKSKRAIPHIKQQLEMTQAQLDVLDELSFNYSQNEISKDDMLQTLYELNLIPKVNVRERQKKITHHTCIKGETRILYGKNAFQNNHVTHHLADKHDMFIHVKDSPGAHVIMKGPYSEETFTFALKLAAFHSKLNMSSSIPVMYTKKSNVGKIPGIYGSYVRIKTYQTRYIDIEENFNILCE